MLNKGNEWYHTEELSYEDLKDHLRDSPEYIRGWAFRGQSERGELETSLERHCRKSGISSNKRMFAEKIITRDFRRIYDDYDSEIVNRDSLYCLSLLRHHDAPTRLLDFSYSSQVALYFGLREAYAAAKNRRTKPSFALWCINVKEMSQKAEKLYSSDSEFKENFDKRAKIKERDESSFDYLYGRSYGRSFDMVISENPVKMHKRLHLQQGVHLCPGNVNKNFMSNLHTLYCTSVKTNEVKKLICRLTIDELQSAFQDLRRVNVTEESLFPGLDGQARSYKYNLKFYTDIFESIHRSGGA